MAESTSYWPLSCREDYHISSPPPPPPPPNPTPTTTIFHYDFLLLRPLMVFAAMGLAVNSNLSLAIQIV
eukprot:3197498-Prorocentrum_lima.AAC.1